MELEWQANMYRLIKWAIKKGFENDYPYPIKDDQMEELLSHITIGAYYDLCSIGEINRFEQ